jgi:hypothetical protein
MNNRQKRKLEAERGRTLSEIGDEKGDLESMLQRCGFWRHAQPSILQWSIEADG